MFGAALILTEVAIGACIADVVVLFSHDGDDLLAVASSAVGWRVLVATRLKPSRCLVLTVVGGRLHDWIERVAVLFDRAPMKDRPNVSKRDT